jgi:large subunit ribosomal protein L10
MTRAEKTATIEALKEKFKDVNFFYITDSSTLTVEEVNNFRRLCFEKGIEMKVIKNTLLKKAFDAISDERNFEEIYEALKGPTAILFTDTANAPARIIKKFRADHEKPVLKAAYIDSDIFFGDDQIETLSKLKSKEELIGEVINLLESPARSVIAALDSGGQTIVNLLTALEEREG